MKVCIRPCLDYKSHFAAASLLARVTELRGKINLFKARPDKDSHQVSLKGTFMWKSSAATFHLSAVTAELGAWGSSKSLPCPNELFLVPQGVFLTLLLGHHRMLYAQFGGCKPAFTFCYSAVQRNKVPTSTHVFAVGKSGKRGFAAVEVTSWNLTAWPFFSVQITKTADSHKRGTTKKAAKRKLLRKFLNALSF